MKRLLILTLLTLAACGTGNKKPMETPKDQLVKRLFTLAENGQIAYGHQDDLAYGHAWRVEDYQNDRLERSDVKEVCGQYPAMMGYELGGIELDADESLDGVPFGLIRKAALTHIGRGGMVTFSWHPRNPVTGGDAWDISSDQAVKAILPGGEKNAEFRVWLEVTGCNFALRELPFPSLDYAGTDPETAKDILTRFAACCVSARDTYAAALAEDFGNTPDWFWE